MFTGIIQHVGRVIGASETASGRRLRVEIGPLAARVAPGGSIAVDGACLTAAAVSGAAADLDAVPETLGRTTLGDLRPGGAVNLELPLAAGAPLDGHVVQGHVDGVAEVVAVDRAGAGHVLRLSAAADLTGQMVPKGSVALAGVSLTLVDVAAGRFSTALVPETLARTTLGELRPGGRVNVELDVLGKYVRGYVAGLLGRPGEGLTAEKLRESGFV